MPTPDRRRDLPAVHVLLARVPDLPHGPAKAAARELLAAARTGAIPADWEGAIRALVAAGSTPHLRPVLNATGVVLHTNLGRAPLSERAAAAVTAVAAGYTNLELDLGSGERGERLAGVAPRLMALFQVEAALAVNNCAAAVLLALSTVAAGREVIVSRGELVEIGGSFRIPEVITACGARLREVGTTNRTRLRDYEAAIGPETGVILRVHPSNFHVAGFTESAPREALVALAHERGLLYVEDLGSGAMVDSTTDASVKTVCDSGADIVCFSGDKLFGGPQAGIVVGRAESVSRMRRHPLYRALRLDRLVLAALEATLIDRCDGVALPIDQMLAHSASSLGPATHRLVQVLVDAGIDAAVVPTEGLAGGGARPADRLPGVGVRIRGVNPDTLATRLRAGRPPVIARVEDGGLIIDLRAVPEASHPALTDALCNALGIDGPATSR